MTLVCPACLIWKGGLETLTDDGFDVTTPLCPLHASMKARKVKLTVKGLIANTHREITLDVDSLKKQRASLRKRLKKPVEKAAKGIDGFA